MSKILGDLSLKIISNALSLDNSIKFPFNCAESKELETAWLAKTFVA